jgi:hypothetical protein
MQQLSQLFNRVLGGTPVRDADLRLAESHVADNGEPGVNASSILAIAGNASQKRVGLEGLRRICEQPGFCGNGPAVALLLLGLERVPLAELQAGGRFDPFVHGAAKHPFLGARINAMRVLRRFAKGGDEKAVQLLKEAMEDGHLYVRTTAAASLGLAGDGSL